MVVMSCSKYISVKYFDSSMRCSFLKTISPEMPGLGLVRVHKFVNRITVFSLQYIILRKYVIRKMNVGKQREF
jgi:hypothetical protein